MAALETTQMKIPGRECHPGKRMNLLDPQKVKRLKFHDNGTECKASKCDEQNVIDCQVLEWNHEDPLVQCNPSSDPPNDPSVRCELEEGCIVEGSCILVFKSATATKTRQRRGQDRQGRPDYFATFLVVFSVLISFALAGDNTPKRPLEGFGYYPYGGYGTYPTHGVYDTGYRGRCGSYGFRDCGVGSCYPAFRERYCGTGSYCSPYGYGHTVSSSSCTPAYGYPHGGVCRI